MSRTELGKYGFIKSLAIQEPRFLDGLMEELKKVNLVPVFTISQPQPKTYKISLFARFDGDILSKEQSNIATEVWNYLDSSYDKFDNPCASGMSSTGVVDAFKNLIFNTNQKLGKYQLPINFTEDQMGALFPGYPLYIP